MGKFIYNTFLVLYRLAIRIAALFFNEKARLFISGRKNILKKIKADHALRTSKTIWFHCASLGEFEQGRPLIEAFKKHFSNYEIILTFFSPSGYEVRKNYPQADYIYYLPIDTKDNAKRFLEYTSPSMAIFVKYEFWHHYIHYLKENNIPTISASSIFRKKQVYFKPWGGFYKRILKNIDKFFVQDKDSLLLLESINIQNIDISGDTRFDRVYEICQNRKTLDKIERFKRQDEVMVIGSCWPEDFEVLEPFINDTSMQYIIAPHEIEGKFISRIENDLAKKTIRYSQISTETDLSQFEVLIIDNIGMLSSLYSYGRYAYVGGAFDQGLHNILEPATFGLPVFFGNKNYQKFKEANDLINLGGAVAIADYDELRIQFRQFTEDQTYNIASEVNTDYIKEHIGATDKIVDYCKSILK